MMWMKPKAKLEEKKDLDNETKENEVSDQREDSSVLSKPEIKIDQGLSAKILAKKMFALEYKDDHSLDLSFIKDENAANELKLIEEKTHSKFIGIIAKCKIEGCDIHALDHELIIIKHFQESEPIGEEFQKARALAGQIDDSVIAILVFDTHNVLMHINGSLEVVK